MTPRRALLFAVASVALLAVGAGAVFGHLGWDE